MYDVVKVGNKEGQVKLWSCEGDEYREGDIVEDACFPTYSIAMREGGFVNISNNIIISWTKEPECKIVLDKWGEIFDWESTRDRILGGPYLYGE